MNQSEKIFNMFHSKLLSEEIRKKFEVIIVRVAILSFLIHLLLIKLVDWNLIDFGNYTQLLNNPIAAIYTPFSFILVYEVYLLLFFLPKSITVYIGKQYEIITLILIRRIFKDLSKLELTSDWFAVKNDLEFTYDLLGTIALFALILFFSKLNKKKPEEAYKKDYQPSAELISFIKTKNIIALCLVPLFFVLAIYSFSHWIYENFFSIGQMVASIKDVNNIFFDECFTILILTDVLLLLVSLIHTDKFSKIIRDSGFIISTILIKLSFGIEGLLNTALIVIAVLFGVIILWIHNQYEKTYNQTNQ
jgi:hypothetical protein